MTNLDAKKLLRILKMVKKSLSDQPRVNLGYLMKQFKLDRDECYWILDRLAYQMKDATIRHDQKGNVIYFENKNFSTYLKSA